MEEPDFPEAQRIIYLISRYIDGAIDFAELQELDQWRKDAGNNEALFQQLIDPNQQGKAIRRMQSYDSKASLEKIRTNIQIDAKRKQSQTINWKKLLVAASSLLFIGLLGYVYFHHKNNELIVAEKQPSDFIPGGTNKAMLTLANGQKISLDDSHNGTIARQSGASIQKKTGGLIAYVPSRNTVDTNTTYNLMETPRGGQYKLELPDGTKVWLNAASSLKYPTSFKGKQRVVTLTGEGYFEVVHNANQPFIVRTATQTIRDIGTAFNVNAYADEPHSATTLVEGSIQLTAGNKTVVLRPGQQAMSQSNIIKVSAADIETATAWKNGQLAFHRTDIQNVLRQISRWYDVDIEYKGKVPGFSISGDVSRDADLSAMLKILQLYDVHFTQQEHKLIIN